MEVLKGNTAEVKFAVPDTLTSATFQVFKDDVQIGTTTLAVTGGGAAICRLPYAAVVDDTDISVVLNFNFEGNNYSPEKIVTVSTPYLDLYEVKDLLDITDSDEALAAEAAARHIINAHCGQNFGKFVGTLSVTGAGDSNLRMPRRLISFSTINGNSYWGDVLSLRGDGWFLQSKSFDGPPSVRADIEGWHYEANSGVITAPPIVDYTTFTKNQEYVITGVWGWDSVPERVRQAALLLVNDYATGDSLYRDRFLTATSAADWTLEFNDGAFTNTGNARANQLLGDYVLRRGWMVV